jgi:hypothetical protein
MYAKLQNLRANNLSTKTAVVTFGWDLDAHLWVQIDSRMPFLMLLGFPYSKSMLGYKLRCSLTSNLFLKQGFLTHIGSMETCVDRS